VDRCSHCGFSFRETGAFTSLAGAASEAALSLVGRVINDKYRVVSVLGEGGFGVVYKVELLLFDSNNTFALKLLHPSLSEDPKFRRRFLREAALAMEIIHENTIQIREFGRTDDGHLFFTMDYCEGTPLNQVIAREGCLALNRALDVTRQILSVMRLAHSRGIIHRDLKPENIFLERSPSRRDFVKVGDFGLAKSFGEGSINADITRGGILGTPRYMSPEQARGVEDLDHRSDLYAVGVILFEMLYGVVPFERSAGDGSANGAGETSTPAAGATPLGVGAAAVPHAVSSILRRALATHREDRYQSAEEFLDALETLPRYTPTYVEPAAPQQARGHPWWRQAAVVAVVGLVIAFLAAVLSDHFPPKQSVPETVARSGPLPLGPLGPVLSEHGIPRERSAPATGGIPSSAGEHELETSIDELKAERTSVLPVWAAPDVRSYLPLQRGATFRYKVRRGKEPERDLVFQVADEPQKGVFLVKVSPGERTFRWVIDERENAFKQEFLLPEQETGEMTRTVTRTHLALPANHPLVEDFTVAGIKVHARPADFGNLYKDCLLVEMREGTRLEFRYFRKGQGLVGLVVYELLAPETTSAVLTQAAQGDPEADIIWADQLPGAAAAALPSSREPRLRYRQVYARYLVP
jgi:serine/threonine protein kinase